MGVGGGGIVGGIFCRLAGSKLQADGTMKLLKKRSPKDFKLRLGIICQPAFGLNRRERTETQSAYQLILRLRGQSVVRKTTTTTTTTASLTNPNWNSAILLNFGTLSAILMLR